MDMTKTYDIDIKDINMPWLIGFIEAEGSFNIILQDDSSIRLYFTIAQHKISGPPARYPPGGGDIC